MPAPVARSTRRTLGMIGVVLTCPCHAVPLLLLLGGTAGMAWLTQYLGVMIAVLVALFLGSLWLLLPRRSECDLTVDSRRSVPETRT